MGAWDMKIFAEDVNVEFLDELSGLDNEDIVEAIEDACKLVLGGTNVSADDERNGLCAATIAAIWAGAPYSAGDVVDEYPFIRELSGYGGEELNAAAAEVLEQSDVEDDLDVYLEALN
ncbi:DUF4259 domain-containing protein [Corynebacterium freiburgense]|uniref:DUF4259 domain-containing protein n=1 Tax=Corynebacterium freiburgense TaxID=556548 RepID=UPI00040B3141|nr:DUF4259 domain-containing protein [Corynebacterium freiburgense]WJZ01911.1 hypothetical protein CFREI_03035 [Corynebacterium freiburgense]